jgi:sulfopyruvate decarboxylase TPP-binding subunit
MFTGPEIVDIFEQLGVTHVVWLPDSTFGLWEPALEAAQQLRLIRVCREGEAWPLAAGLHVGGKSPIVVMQTTGFFESGDAMRNVLFDLQLPIFAVIGARNWLIPDSRDSAKRFADPIVNAWGLDYVLIGEEADKPRLAEHYRACSDVKRPGAVLLAEGRG